VILVLSKGRLVQSGAHDDLVKVPGPYRDAALLQLIYAAATDPEADPAKALTYIAGMAQAGISDVGRFAPAAMRQAAAEQAAQMAADAAPD